MADGDIELVFAEYADFAGAAPDEFSAAADGLSGAVVWKVRFGATAVCLRRWPGPAAADRLARVTWIHRILAGTASAGFDRLAVPRTTRAGKTWVVRSGQIWEVAPWLPGVADVQGETASRRLTAALEALALFHLAAAKVEAPSERSHPPTLQARTQQLTSLLKGDFLAWQTCVRRAAGQFSPLAESLLPLARHWCELFPRVAPRMADSLAAAGTLRVPLQPCLRDIHREHVLFVGEEVTGLIDYDAMRTETVAADVARLLESYAGADPQLWRLGVDAYSRIRPLSDDERRLLPVLDASSVLLSSANWIDWLYVQRRGFSRIELVRGRLAHWIQRLENLATTPLFLDIR